MQFKNGVNIFDEYETIKFTIEYPERTKEIKSFQISWGGWVEFLDDEVARNIRLYNYSLKKFFAERVRDGYFKKDFIFIDGITERILNQKKGILFSKAFFFLEDPCSRKFLVEYMMTLFEEMDTFHRTHPAMKFKKYEPARRKNSNHQSI